MLIYVYTGNHLHLASLILLTKSSFILCEGFITHVLLYRSVFTNCPRDFTISLPQQRFIEYLLSIDHYRMTLNLLRFEQLVCAFLTCSTHRVYIHRHWFNLLIKGRYKFFILLLFYELKNFHTLLFHISLFSI